MFHALSQRFDRALIVAVVGLALLAGLIGPAGAASKGEELVEESRFTLQRLLADPDLPDLKRYVSNAQGVLIIPELVKGGFILGAEGGSGVLMVRGTDGTWSAPAFYTLAAGSIGLQAGGQVSEVVFAIMNQGAVNAIINDEIKLGADASVAVGPFGAGLEASTTTHFDADIYAFSRAVGLFGGGAFEGAKLISRQDWNDDYYGAKAPPHTVLIERKFFNPQADPLRSALP